MRYKPWTEEELQYLRDNWGTNGRTEIAEALGRSFHSVRSQARYLGLRKLSTAGLTPEQLKICREYAADPDLTQDQLLERLGFSDGSRSYLLRLIRHAGISWAKRRGVHREFTEAELQLCREYAADPNRSKKDLRETLRTNNEVVSRLIEQLGVKWIDRQQLRMQLTLEQITTLRRLAADNTVSWADAAKKMGTNVPHLRRLCDHHNIPWASARHRSRAPVRHRQDPPAGLTVSPKLAAQQAEKRPHAQPKQARQPGLTITPAIKAGRPGYRWHSDEINGGGWIAAGSLADAEREAQRIVGLVLQRRHAA